MEIGKYEKRCYIGILISLVLGGLMLYFGEVKHYDLIAKILGFSMLIIGAISVNSLFIFALPERLKLYCKEVN